uniref:Uncharacterized protein n=1 Tax=viral metagenome TaxID=1070528 RepID=A0A6M3JUC8_9ZZZZ
MDKVSFVGIIKKVEAKALVSLDKNYRIQMDTENSALMEAGTWPADETVRVTIERVPKGS